MNLRKLCIITCIFFVLVFSQENALAATIHGTVYEWNSFKPLNNSVVEINSTPEQSFVATNAEYSFNLTPGTYLIKAIYYEKNVKVYNTTEEVLISDENGEYVHDLLMFPSYGEELLDQSSFKGPDLNFGETKAPVQKNKLFQINNQKTIVFSFVFLALITVLLLGGYFLRKRNKKNPDVLSSSPEEYGDKTGLKSQSPPEEDAEFPENLETDTIENPLEDTDISQELPLTSQELPVDTAEKTDYQTDDDKSVLHTKYQDHDRWHFPFSSKEQNKSSSEHLKYSRHNLPEDLRELLELIRNSGNRITQREIRKKSPYSESKVSLMLSDLEQRGLIEKFKEGEETLSAYLIDISINKKSMKVRKNDEKNYL